MNKHYAILKIQKLNRKERRELQMRCNHANRNKNAANVDPTKVTLNRCLVGLENSDWYSLFKERYAALTYYKLPETKQLRKDAVIGVEVVASMSHEAVEYINIEDWCNANTEWMKKHFGEENVLHGVLHMDEGTPHIHFFVTPVLNGRFNSKEFLGGKLDFVRRQTEYAKAMEPFGLVRGSQNERLNYLSVQELYHETGQGVEDLPNTKENETAEEYRERVNELYCNSQLRENKLRNKNKLLSSVKEHNEEYQAIIAAKDQLIAEYEERLENMEIRGIKVKNIIAAVEKHEDQNTISKYLADIASLAEVGEELLAIEKEQERQ